MARKNNNNYKETIESHPFIVISSAFVGGFIISSGILIFYYSNRIDDIKDRYEYMFQQEKRNFEVELKNKTLEIQIEEREKHYIKVDENSLNGKLLEKTLELMEKKGGKNEK